MSRKNVILTLSIGVGMICLAIFLVVSSPAWNHSAGSETTGDQLFDGNHTADSQLSEEMPVVSTQATEQIYVDTPGLYFYDITEFQNFVKNTELPEAFVTAEDVSEIGSFEGWVCLSEFRLDDYSEYMYSLLPENGDSFALYVRHSIEKEQHITKILDISEAAENMSELSAMDSGVIQRNGVRYTYVNGSLLTINWKVEDTEFTISELDYETLQPGSLLHRLLSVSDTSFRSAVSEISNISLGSSETG